RNTRRIIEAFPVDFSSRDEICEQNPGDGAMCHAVSSIAGHNINIFVAGISSNKSKAVNGLHNLAGPAEFRLAGHEEALSRPSFQPAKSFLGIVGLARLMVLPADEEDLMLQFLLKPDIMKRVGGVPIERFRHRSPRYA